MMMKIHKTLHIISLATMITMLGIAAYSAPNMDFFQICRRGTIEEVRAAIENGADVNAKQQSGQSALFSAVQNKNLDVVSLLIKKGADVNARDNEGFTVLMMVASMIPDPIPIMRELIDNGADLNSQDKEGETALMFAAEAMQGKESEKVMSFLLDSGANPNLKNSSGETALDIAVRLKKYEGTEILKRLESVTSAKPN